MSLSENFNFSHSYATTYLSSNVPLLSILCSWRKWALLSLSSEMNKPHNEQRVNNMPRGPAPAPALLSFTCFYFHFL